MAIRNLRIDDDPVLRKISRPVDKFDARLSSLIDDLFDTMYKNEGVGLAAPQVGILKRVAVVDTMEGTKLELVNPEIVEKNGCYGALEGCLSYPGQSGYVERAEHITVRAQDRHGREHTYKLEMFPARAAQHEIDHLNGVIYLDLVIDPPEGFKEEE